MTKQQLENTTESAILWVWWSTKTGGFGLSRVYGHRNQAMADWWLSEDKHELRQIKITFLPQ